MSIRESGQDYLETILILRRRNGVVHSMDIVQELGYSKASISVAMKVLIKNGFIIMNSDKEITLTDKGKALAEIIYERHLFLSDWLEYIGVDHDTASKDACKIEHDLSVKSFEAIKANALEQIRRENQK